MQRRCSRESTTAREGSDDGSSSASEELRRPLVPCGTSISNDN